MNYEQCTYSPELAEDCLLTSSLDTNQLSLLSGSHTPAESLENAPQKDGFPACTCGKEMSGCLIHPNTRDEWIASMQDSLAKTLALLESRQAYLKEPDQVFTEKYCALLTQYDLSSSSWRTLQQSFLTDSEQFSETWPRWGMTAAGSAYAHPMSGLRITEIDGSFWQTPVADDSANRKAGKWNSRGEPKLIAQAMFPTPTVKTGAQVAWDKTPGQTGGTSLSGFVKYFPTPTTNDAKNSKLPESQRFMDGMAGALMRDGEKAGGQLNPNWVGWLMGFPIGWASSKATETHKSRCKPQQLSNSCTDKEAA